MTDLELIKQTAAFYSADTSRRAMSGSGNCMYLAPNGNKCAVGRCMTDASLKDNAVVEQTANKFKNLDSLLLPQYQGHPVKLWESLQQLHDGNYNWDQNGLTGIGKIELQRLEDQYS